jgi:hypothetical protein
VDRNVEIDRECFAARAGARHRWMSAVCVYPSYSLLIWSMGRKGGGDLVARAPQGALSPRLRQMISRSKVELLSLLQDDGFDLAEADVVDFEAAAYLLRSERYGEAWLDPDASSAYWLRETCRAGGRPVLTFEEALRLRGRSRRALKAALGTKRALPDATVIQ